MAIDDSKIAQFKQITQVEDTNTAIFYLESANEDVDTAISQYFSNTSTTTGNNNNNNNEIESNTSASSNNNNNNNTGMNIDNSNSNREKIVTSSSNNNIKKQKKRIASFKDLNNDSDSDDEKKKYYAGGGKSSGQQIIGGDDDDNNNNNKKSMRKNEDAQEQIKKIFESAKNKGALIASEHEDQLKKEQLFAGSGRRLGENVPQDSSSSGKDESSQSKTQQVEITFYKEGFTVDNGELRLYQNPKNKDFLEAINKGYVPNEVKNLSTNKNSLIDVHLIDKKSENYKPPEKKFKAFEGGGRSLASSSSSKSSSSSSSNDNVSSTNQNLPKYELDESKPKTSIQIRLADGSKKVGKFNLNHTIGTIRQYIISMQGNQQPFDLMIPFPRKVLQDNSQTIEEAGLKGASIVQQLK
jgi:UBX domain-containing protein 1